MANIKNNSRLIIVQLLYSYYLNQEKLLFDFKNPYKRFCFPKQGEEFKMTSAVRKLSFQSRRPIIDKTFSQKHRHLKNKPRKAPSFKNR